MRIFVWRTLCDLQNNRSSTDRQTMQVVEILQTCTQLSLSLWFVHYLSVVQFTQFSVNLTSR